MSNKQDHGTVNQVAGMQLGALNYRRKAKKSKGEGLTHNFEFGTNDHAEESLNRIIGKVAYRSKPKNLMIVDMSSKQQRSGLMI